jgi:hypothetical protein
MKMVMAMALDDSVSLFEFQMMLFLVVVMLLLYCIYLQFCTFSRHLYVLYLWLNVIIYLLIQKKKKGKVIHKLGEGNEKSSAEENIL